PAEDAPGPETSATMRPLVHTFRCRGVSPIDPLILADSSRIDSVTTVPSPKVRVIEPPCRGTKVSAFAAPDEHSPSPTVTAAARPTSRKRRTELPRIMRLLS